MVREFDDFTENLEKTISWCGALHKSLRELVAVLKHLQLSAFQDKALYREAGRKLRDANRCESRINRFYEKAKKARDKILQEKLLPVPEEKQFIGLCSQARPHEVVLIVQDSFFRGRMNKDFVDLCIQIGLVHKGKGQPAVLRNKAQTFTRDLEKLIAEPQKAIPGQAGLVPFMVVLQNMKDLMEGMQRQARAAA